MVRFKVGDIVKCVNSREAYGLTKGSLYRVEESNISSITVQTGGGAIVSYYNFRFELDEAATERTSGTDTAAKRKATPVYSGVLKYFPRALQAVAKCSKVGNDQHNPGEPLHWAREKSGDELDALTRHLLDAGTIDTDGIRHSTKVAWRALANLEKELEKADEQA